MVGSSLEQSQAMLTQLREQLQKQTEQMLGSFTFKR